MINLKNFKGFVFQSYDNSIERQKLTFYFLKNNIPYIIFKNKKGRIK